jgi:hypothetical protein
MFAPSTLAKIDVPICSIIIIIIYYDYSFVNSIAMSPNAIALFFWSFY